MSFVPTFEEFCAKAEEGNLIPVYREIMADLETPVSAYLKIGGPNSYLLESVEGGEKWARYTFLGGQPEVVVSSKGRTLTVKRNGVEETRSIETDPLDADSDSDGVQDATELGVTAGVGDPDGAGGPLLGTDGGVFVPDADPLTMTDPLDDDTDGDGLTDGTEDTNGNGAVDPGESDPLDPGSPAPDGWGGRPSPHAARRPSKTQGPQRPGPCSMAPDLRGGVQGCGMWAPAARLTVTPATGAGGGQYSLAPSQAAPAAYPTGWGPWRGGEGIAGSSLGSANVVE